MFSLVTFAARVNPVPRLLKSTLVEVDPVFPRTLEPSAGLYSADIPLATVFPLNIVMKVSPDEDDKISKKLSPVGPVAPLIVDPVTPAGPVGPVGPIGPVAPVADRTKGLLP